MEGLHIMIKKIMYMVTMECFKPTIVGNNEMMSADLLYAGDVIILGEWFNENLLQSSQPSMCSILFPI